MSSLDLETSHLLRDIFALPEKERVKVFAKLREDLAQAGGPSKIDELNEKMAYAIEIFDKVADHLGLDNDIGKLGLRMREFDAAPTTVREGYRARNLASIYFGSWSLVKQAAF